MSRKIFLAFAVLLLALGVAGCMAKPVPLSAQRGSTILIPIPGGSAHNGPVDPIGFGGSQHTDFQRGRLVFQLGGPGGFELTTRLATEVVPSPRLGGTSVTFAGGRQILVLVDIPTNAPLGTHDLHMVHRQDGVDTPVSPEYQGSIAILPESVDVPLAGGGQETVVGSATPLQYYGGHPINGVGWNGVPPNFLVPNPGFDVSLSKVSQQNDPRRASASAVEVTYPDSKIDIANVEAKRPTIDVCWHESVSSGVIHVHAVALVPESIGSCVVTFSNTGGQPAVDETEIQATLLGATDQFGSDAIESDWSITASAGTIR